MYNKSMDDARMEVALSPLVRMFLLFIPYCLVMLILGSSYIQSQSITLVSFFLVGIISFFVELFMTYLLEQDFIGIIVYVVLIGGMFVLSYLLIVPSFLFLSGNKTDTISISVSVIHIYLVLYWIHIGVKGFFKAIVIPN